jgi:sulfatase maturation enzyme AslB (radical SAM superfamily)
MIQNGEFEKPDDILNLQLIITEQCNLRCRYCFEINKGSRQMPLELAKEILKRELSREDSPDEYLIDLVGGEPLLRFVEIKELIEHCISNANAWPKKFHFSMCTNLTLLSTEMEQWFEKNQQWIVLATSLDGTRDAHNHYRCESYDMVIKNLPFYKRLYPTQGVKMTIGPDTISSIYDSILNIESLDLSPNANVVFEPVWGDLDSKKDCLREFRYQLELLVEHYAQNMNLKVPNLLSLPIHKLINPRDKDYRWCGSGIHMRAYDTDGRELPCHRFSRFSSDEVYEGDKSIGPHVPTKCDECMYIAACPTCRGYNWQVFGNPDSRTSYHCEFIKLQILATAKLQYLLNKPLVKSLLSGEFTDDVPGSTLRTLRAASIVFNSLNENDIIETCELE